MKVKRGQLMDGNCSQNVGEGNGRTEYKTDTQKRGAVVAAQESVWKKIKAQTLLNTNLWSEFLQKCLILKSSRDWECGYVKVHWQKQAED